MLTLHTMYCKNCKKTTSVIGGGVPEWCTFCGLQLESDVQEDVCFYVDAAKNVPQTVPLTEKGLEELLEPYYKNSKPKG